MKKSEVIQWSIENGDIVAALGGTEMWRGRCGGAPGIGCVEAGDHRDAIILLDPDSRATGRFANVVRLRADGTIMWTAELPSRGDDDAYVHLRRTQRGVEANSWSGFSVYLDEGSGKIINKEFVK